MNLLIVLPPILFPAWILVWHFFLILKRTGEDRPRTISAHAEEQGRLLLIHRLSHSLPLIATIPFTAGYLLPHNHHMAAFILILATIFDAAEVATLRKTPDLDAGTGSGGLVHKIAAWLMAVSYLLYAAIISVVADVGVWLYWFVFAFLACVLLAFFRKGATTQKHFFILQMAFFMLVTFVMLIAHITLLAKAY
jgi:hypothetical protein